jgi:D-alanyl-D-alanine carboxypeptidase
MFRTPSPLVVFPASFVALGSAWLALATPVQCLMAQATAPLPSRVQFNVTDAALRDSLQRRLDTYRSQAGFPGAVLAMADANGRVVTVASGLADTARRDVMRTDHRLLMGSVGKTYVAAVALQLLREGRLDLDAPAARYVGGQGWFDSIAHAPSITVRHLMTHSSGVVRYEFRPDFAADLMRDPGRVWDPRDQVRYLHGQTPPFEPGKGWEYSDTNYLILALVLEAITGRPIDDEIATRLLRPFNLRETMPSDSRALPGVSQGYAGAQNPFGGQDAMFAADGRMIVNPQFEGAGGGYAATAADAARWGALFFSGRAFGESLLPQALSGPAARLGAGTRYGLGMILRDSTVAGPMRGHSGFFPGYLTELRHYPARGVTIALLVNASAVRATPPMARWVDELASGLRSDQP